MPPKNPWKGAGTKAKGTSGVTPKPKNVLPPNVRCYIRYGNAGVYRFCPDFGKKAKGKPQKLAPLITPAQFITNVGKSGYADLTAGQQKEYHRLDMAGRRAEERELLSKNKEEMISLKKAEFAERKKAGQVRRTEAMKKRLQAQDNKIKRSDHALKHIEKKKKLGLPLTQKQTKLEKEHKLGIKEAKQLKAGMKQYVAEAKQGEFLMEF